MLKSNRSNNRLRQTSKTNANGLEIERFAFDPNDRATNRWTAAKGNTIYTFDAVGNVLTINYPLSPAINFLYDSLNRLTNRTDAVGTNVFTYKATSQLLTENGPWANDTLSYTYANRLRQSLSLQQPSGTWTNGYSYVKGSLRTFDTNPEWRERVASICPFFGRTV